MAKISQVNQLSIAEFLSLIICVVEKKTEYCLSQKWLQYKSFVNRGGAAAPVVNLLETQHAAKKEST